MIQDAHMTAYELNPTSDHRWNAFLQDHPKASVFHGTSWLKVLQSSYAYEPIVFTTSPPGRELKNGLVFCDVKSRLTGRRLVSLPFSDHCEPLCDSAEEFHFLLQHLQSSLPNKRWKYLEIRPATAGFSQIHGEFVPTAKHFLHLLNLQPSLEALLRSFDKDSIQRRIQRADRANLVEVCDSSGRLLNDFYKLFLITRSRQQLPPIPRIWFRNLIAHLGSAHEIRVAYLDQKPIAAILTLRFKDIAYYKYGCSDHHFNKFGAMPWLLWRAIASAKSSGALQFDLGRTEEGNTGLLAFKNHWVPQPREMLYWNFPVGSVVGPANSWKVRAAKRIFSLMPHSMLALSGRLIYPHIG
jgi:hypothetical protein